MTRLTPGQLRQLGVLPGSPSKNKYNARKVTFDSIIFDSQKEANKYLELKLLKKAGEIKDFMVKPEKFVLLEGFTHKGTGEKVRAITYTPDFKIVENDGYEWYLDTKGKRTEPYILRKKLLLAKYPNIDFREE